MNDTRQKCELCGGLGKNGAQYLVQTNDGKVVKVHRPCGEKLVESAPKELGAKLIPSPELRAEWTAKRTERQAKDFWANKCPQLLEIKKGLEQKEQVMT